MPGSKADKLRQGKPSPRIILIGAGIAGILMEIKLRERGWNDFVILEKAESLDGTWRDNQYPGAACDVPAHLYVYSFAPNPAFSRSTHHAWKHLPEKTRYHTIG
jgi:cation diffusion facilitator CzcD-associated flavoprotein CzcO